ncbi:sigma-70 family RNA polymerase sigma factor [Clostridium sardiniense]|uniref:sigma-70 family RNA polymerase sigma factor n=1 Tax=Clostridium sardiniense TaxID=29369 RepID=UPI00195E2856|nr:sigma-70 family RNA polymerase sigma factor [Clostridium sardiniense]MBM7834543.1 RNA polymerase sigma-70 factor (ECF subfamily) [Clostridium sardiniense]
MIDTINIKSLILRPKSNSEFTSEELIIKRAIKGDKISYEKLIKANKEYLYKLAFLYVKNEQDALDIIQETVYKGFLNISKLKNVQFFNTWLSRILINTSIDFIKKRDRALHTPITNIDYSSIYIQYNTSKIESNLDLYNAIDLLKYEYKTVIILKYFEDMKIDEISKILDIPKNTVKTYLKRGRESLSKILKEDYLNE